MQRNPDNEDDESGQSGGQDGTIHFRYQDPLTTPKRDDLLPPQEIKRLLVEHQERHKIFVDKQKQTRKDREAFKDKKSQHQATQNRGLSHGQSNFKKHPIIGEKAQFSGMDPQVSLDPSLNEAKTNDELRNELQNRLQHRPGQQRVFNPKPRPL